ncbi:hypothetical protein SDC9_80182 [bioreactor metagenome]|uniref:Uncharacterized protein n=1 Tax=bioreactor metagenome TaxID=1076179 RepID=A0A644YYB2_9ZZZZ
MWIIILVLILYIVIGKMVNENSRIKLALIFLLINLIIVFLVKSLDNYWESAIIAGCFAIGVGDIVHILMKKS